MLIIFLLSQIAAATFHGIIRINIPALCLRIGHSPASLTTKMLQLGMGCPL
jgi:hypothetical protein